MVATTRAPTLTLLVDEETHSGGDDRRQARDPAMLFCKSEDAVESFIAHCDIAARDLLMPYGDVLMVLSVPPRIRRTLSGAEIDKIIWDVETRKALAKEQRRRAECREREIRAERFQAACDPR